MDALWNHNHTGKSHNHHHIKILVLTLAEPQQPLHSKWTSPLEGRESPEAFHTYSGATASPFSRDTTCFLPFWALCRIHNWLSALGTGWHCPLQAPPAQEGASPVSRCSLSFTPSGSIGHTASPLGVCLHPRFLSAAAATGTCCSSVPLRLLSFHRNLQRCFPLLLQGKGAFLALHRLCAFPVQSASPMSSFLWEQLNRASILSCHPQVPSEAQVQNHFQCNTGSSLPTQSSLQTGSPNLCFALSIITTITYKSSCQHLWIYPRCKCHLLLEEFQRLLGAAQGAVAAPVKRKTNFHMWKSTFFLNAKLLTAPPATPHNRCASRSQPGQGLWAKLYSLDTAALCRKGFLQKVLPFDEAAQMFLCLFS